ncbi:hypothetical protein MA16_Dca013736 [Dendrobium catenatum]|uniref:Uncharacterized protein n=1 Tax=Dendrobium catenatum TaxID=906689 RepID=A0A2I0VWC5_9ASPA|nr:hypothetical protein MA16_Dca013736 [Dendrobium catenatum]
MIEKNKSESVGLRKDSARVVRMQRVRSHYPVGQNGRKPLQSTQAGRWKSRWESSISDTQALFEDKLIDKDVNEEDKEINLQGQADGVDQNLSLVQNIETKQTTENERKPAKAPLDSTRMGVSEDRNVEAETQDAANIEFSKDKDDIELIKPEDLKDEIQISPDGAHFMSHELSG